MRIFGDRFIGLLPVQFSFTNTLYLLHVIASSIAMYEIDCDMGYMSLPNNNLTEATTEADDGHQLPTTSPRDNEAAALRKEQSADQQAAVGASQEAPLRHTTSTANRSPSTRASCSSCARRTSTRHSRLMLLRMPRRRLKQ